jgi:hypothetical protein
MTETFTPHQKKIKVFNRVYTMIEQNPDRQAQYTASFMGHRNMALLDIQPALTTPIEQAAKILNDLINNGEVRKLNTDTMKFFN